MTSESGFARYRPTLLLVGFACLVVGVAVVALQPAKPPAPPVTAPPPAGSAPPPPPQQPVMASAPPPVPSPSAASSLRYDGDAGVYLIKLDDGSEMPLPPGVTSASIVPQLPAEQPQTPEWKLEKTKRIYAVVEERSKRLAAEADELEKKGDAEGARTKRTLAKRLEKQLASMNKEMADYQAQMDGGVH
jgi:hypothetical protein